MPEPSDATPHFEVRRAQIMLKAGELFAGKGVAATTVREIADGVGLLSGSLYHYFDSKEGIVDEILREYLNALLEVTTEIRAKFRDDPKACLAALIHASFRALDEYSSAYTIMQNDINYLSGLPRFSYLNEAVREIQEAGVSVLRAGIDRGVFRSELDPAISFRFARDAMWLTVGWYRRGGKYSIDELADAYVSFVMEGIATQRRRKPRRPSSALATTPTKRAR